MTLRRADRTLTGPRRCGALYAEFFAAFEDETTTLLLPDPTGVRGSTRDGRPGRGSPMRTHHPLSR